MAYRTFNDFDSFQPSFSDYVVGYSPLRGEYRTQIITLSNLITGGGTVLYNYFSTVSAAINAVIGLSGAYTVVAQNSAKWNSTNPAYTSLSAGSITARYVDIFHTPANDGTNPIIRIGEIDNTSGNAGFSGVYISYNETTNTFGISSQFAPGPGIPVLNIDRFGVASGPMLPYTTTLTKFNTAAQASVSTTFYPGALSGMIPAAEITSRIREGKGMMQGAFLFTVNTPGAGQPQVRLQFDVNPNFTGSRTTNIFVTSMTTGPAQSSVVKAIQGYVVDNMLVFQGNQPNPYSVGSSNELINFPYGVDIYYRAGFTALVNNTTCTLSGGSISIIP
jgi:hypothetical protein